MARKYDLISELYKIVSHDLMSSSLFMLSVRVLLPFSKSSDGIILLDDG